MTARRRRALASAVGALVVAVLCAVLSSNVDGGQRTVLLVLTVAWLVIAAMCIANALRTASADAAPGEAPGEPVGGSDDPA
jgi:ABC-type Fe3+ transport system permease subunit